MMGKVDQGARNQLHPLDGAAFDTLWARSMISRHQGAITMAAARNRRHDTPDQRKTA